MQILQASLFSMQVLLSEHIATFCFLSYVRNKKGIVLYMYIYIYSSTYQINFDFDLYVCNF